MASPSGRREERTEASESLCWGCHSHGVTWSQYLPAQCPLRMRPQPLAATSMEGCARHSCQGVPPFYRENRSMVEGTPPHAQGPAAPKVWWGQVSS